ncbi:ABC transporter permease [Metabacillus fastidiosus]|uniref:ABC transporter permease n=1 Tax=Metabacillus fastidiosus TaxID=1458 RepID=UPI002E24561F|nr:ABC transporter permease [Metabacillus fastidiosus]
MKELFWLIANIFKITFKDKKNYIVYIVLPLVGIMIALVAYGGESDEKIRIGVIDEERTEMTEDTISFLGGLENTHIISIKKSEIEDKIVSGSLDAVLLFEKGFSNSMKEGNPDHIQISSIRGAEITGFIKIYLYNYLDNIAAIAKVAKNEAEYKAIYDNYKRSSFKLVTNELQDTSKNKKMTYQSIGFLIMIMLFGACNLSEIILKEKERRTYFRLLASPLSSKQYVSANIIVNFIILAAQIILTLLVMTKIFGIDLNIPFIEMLVIMLLFALVAVGLSILIVAFSKSSSAAGALQKLVILPTCLLSGCFWPMELMPEAIQKVSDFLPQKWVLATIMEHQRGEQFGDLYLNYLILFSFALTFFLIAIYKFGRNNNVRNFV